MSVYIVLPISLHQVYFGKISIMLQVGHDVPQHFLYDRPSGTSELITTFAVIINEKKENKWILPHSEACTP